jgi:hypothetical protein
VEDEEKFIFTIGSVGGEEVFSARRRREGFFEAARNILAATVLSSRLQEASDQALRTTIMENFI